MAELPADPMLAKMLLAAEQYGVVEQVLTICAMLDVNAAVFYRPQDKAVHADAAKAAFGRGRGAHGDHMQLKNVYEQWAETDFSTQFCYENYVQVRSMRKARDIREQLAELCQRIELTKCSNPDDSEAVRKAVTAGYFYHTAKIQRDGSFKTIKNAHQVHVHPSSALHKLDPMPQYLVYHQLQFTKQEYMRQIIEIQPQWLVEIAPHYYRPKDLEADAQKDKATLQSKVLASIAKQAGDSQRDPRAKTKPGPA